MKLDVATLQYVSVLLEKEGFPRAAVIIGTEAQIAASAQRAEAAAAALAPAQIKPVAAK